MKRSKKKKKKINDSFNITSKRLNLIVIGIKSS